MFDRIEPQMQYDFTSRMNELYRLLQDRLSKDLFWARMRFDISPDMDAAIDICSLNQRITAPVIGELKNWRKYFETAADEKKRIVLYGAGTIGQKCIALFAESDVEIAAFCDRSKAGRVICGKPVISPETLLQNADDCYVMITTELYYDEISAFLLKQGFPEEHIILYLGFRELKPSYFDFPQLIEEGAAFVDGGCYNGADAIRFAQLTQGNYSKILAFEPDRRCWEVCKEKLQDAGVERVELLQAGLSDKTEMVSLVASANGGSFIMDLDDNVAPNVNRPQARVEEIPTMLLDDLTSDTKIGMIKMDIEGAEFNALHGAEKTILRDKPFLAICVYHRRGDILAILDYLHSLVPEYRFWLRQDGPLAYDTVLFAAV